MTRSLSSTKIFFWRFVSLSELGPSEKLFVKRLCGSNNEKQKKMESCSFLDAIGRRSCGPLSGLAKNRHVGKSKLRLKRIETAGWYTTVRLVILLWLALQHTFAKTESEWLTPPAGLESSVQSTNSFFRLNLLKLMSIIWAQGGNHNYGTSTAGIVKQRNIF